MGVSGFNIWNSWLAFKAAPQIYDGLVLILCTNDANMFERSYKLAKFQWASMLPGSDDPFGQSVAACFDDIAAFCTAARLPVIVIFAHFSGSLPQCRVAELVGGRAPRAVCRSLIRCRSSGSANWRWMSCVSAWLMVIPRPLRMAL